MILSVRRREWSLAEADNLRELAADIDSDADLTAPGLAELGRVDGEYLWFSIAAIRERGESIVKADQLDVDAWQERFDSMIVYAASKGWIDASRSLVRAHIRNA